MHHVLRSTGFSDTLVRPAPRRRGWVHVVALLVLLVAGAAPAGAATVPNMTTIKIVGGLNNPTFATTIPGDGHHLFVLEQYSGKIQVVDLDSKSITGTFMTVASINATGEEGLLGMAFDPTYTTNGRFYIFASITGGSFGSGHSEVQTYTANGAAPFTAASTGNAASKVILQQWDKPQTNHNGGWIGFNRHANDHQLFISVGDGGNGDDTGSGHTSPGGNAQDATVFLGKILRVDVGAGTSYTIPADNPFANDATRKHEIFAIGVRNPWRCSFDRQSGDFWIGEVGQNQHEEIDFNAGAVPGMNYGWRAREGLSQNTSFPGEHPTGTTDPILDYPHSGGNNCVIGGYVYRGSAIPDLQGLYLYGDNGGTHFWTIANPAGTVVNTDVTAPLVAGTDHPSGPSSFAEDDVGEMYIVSYGNGSLFKIVPNLVITTASPLPGTTTGATYSQTLAVSGSGTKTWSVSGGSVAPLTLSAGGVLSGTAGAAGTITFTAQVTNGSATGFKAFTVTVNPPPTITSAAALPDATVDSAYSRTLAASGGTGALTWSSTGLSDGLSLSAGGVLSGTPTAAATVSFTAKVTDSVGVQVTKSMTVQVLNAGGTTAPTITSTAVTTANLGFAYTYDVQATGSPAPTFSLTTKPTGMTIDASSGVITWPTPMGTSAAVTVQATNGTAPVATQSFTIAVSDFGLVARPVGGAFLGGTMPATASGALPSTLTATGAFSDVGALTPSAALLPYTVNLAFFSDGAIKTRFVAVPHAAGAADPAIGFAATDFWTFPTGTVFVKHFAFNTDQRDSSQRQRLETRLIVVQADGNVYGVTYKWNSAGTEATLVDAAGATEDLTITAGDGSTHTQSWYYPSRGDCLTCHNATTGRVLGVTTRQLNGDFTYATSGRTDNQLRTWSHIGMFNAPPAEASIPALQKIAVPSDTSVALESRARSYLDVNCAYCHRPGGAPANFDARLLTPLVSQNIVDGPVNNTLGIAGAKVVVMGHQELSILYQRLHTVDPAISMPKAPVNRRTIDAEGSAMIAAWIGSGQGSGTTPPPAGDGGGKKCGLGAGFAVLSFMLVMIGWRRRLR